MVKLIDTPKYTFSDGTEIELKPVPPFMIHAISNNRKDAPTAPYVEFERAGKKKVEQNYGDPDYKKALEDYEEYKSLQLMQLLFTQGVVGSVKDHVKDKSELPELISLTKMIYGNDYSEVELKYTWIVSKLSDEDDIKDFQDAIQGITTVTDSAIEDSKSNL